MFSPVQTSLDRLSRCLVAISHPRYIRPADRWYFHRRSLEGLHSSHVIVRRRCSPLGSARETARATGCRSRPWVDNMLFFIWGCQKLYSTTYGCMQINNKSILRKSGQLEMRQIVLLVLLRYIHWILQHRNVCMSNF